MNRVSEGVTGEDFIQNLRGSNRQSPVDNDRFG